jgi:hypothetical protein
VRWFVVLGWVPKNIRKNTSPESKTKKRVNLLPSTGNMVMVEELAA